MKLNIYERIVLVNVLPEKGSFETVKMIDALRNLLYPSEKEIKQFEIVQEDKSLKWNKKAMEEKELPFTVMEKAFIIKEFEKLSKSELLTVDHYKIYQKFVEKTE